MADMSGGEAIGLIGIFIVVMVVSAVCGFGVGSEMPGVKARQLIRCELACQLQGEKLITVAPNDECICEQVRLFAGDTKCK